MSVDFGKIMCTNLSTHLVSARLTYKGSQTIAAMGVLATEAIQFLRFYPDEIEMLHFDAYTSVGGKIDLRYTKNHDIEDGLVVTFTDEDFK